jgi:hypothetical protein
MMNCYHPLVQWYFGSSAFRNLNMGEELLVIMLSGPAEKKQFAGNKGFSQMNGDMMDMDPILAGLIDDSQIAALLTMALLSYLRMRTKAQQQLLMKTRYLGMWMKLQPR